jgi:hypothetical protein
MEPSKTEDLIAQLNSPPPERQSQNRQAPKTVAPKTPQRHQQMSYAPKTGPPKFDLQMSNPLISERLRLVRRQTLQFAPKIGSPLARSWKPIEPEQDEDMEMRSIR